MLWGNTKQRKQSGSAEGSFAVEWSGQGLSEKARMQQRHRVSTNNWGRLPGRGDSQGSKRGGDSHI